MKKNWINRRGVPIHVLKKVFLMMKLTFLLTVVLQVSTWATGVLPGEQGVFADERCFLGNDYSGVTGTDGDSLFL